MHVCILSGYHIPTILKAQLAGIECGASSNVCSPNARKESCLACVGSVLRRAHPNKERSWLWETPSGSKNPRRQQSKCQTPGFKTESTNQWITTCWLQPLFLQSVVLTNLDCAVVARTNKQQQVTSVLSNQTEWLMYSPQSRLKPCVAVGPKITLWAISVHKGIAPIYWQTLSAATKTHTTCRALMGGALKQQKDTFNFDQIRTEIRTEDLQIS